MRQTDRSKVFFLALTHSMALAWAVALAPWPAAASSDSETTASVEADDATREEMERLMEAHRKLSVERSLAARARVNRSPAIPRPHKNESAAPLEAADEITVRQVD